MILGNGLMSGGGGGAAPPSAFLMTSATAGGNQVTVVWAASAGATTYTLKRGTTTGVYGTTVSTNAMSPYVDTGLTGGTTYYYRVDAVNSGGTTTSTNEVSATPIGVVANAKSLLFDGVDEFCDFGSTYNPERTNSWTWFALVKYGAGGSIIGNIKNGGAYNGTAITVTSGGKVNVQIVNNDGVNAVDIITNAGFSSGAWHRLFVTYSGNSNASGVNVYVDEVLQAKTTNLNTLSASSLGTTFNFGRLNYPGSYYGGNLDEVSLWQGTVLTLSQVQELGALIGSGIVVDFSAYTTPATNWWRFGDLDDSITSIKDRIGSLNATPTNMEAGDIVTDAA